MFLNKLACELNAEMCSRCHGKFAIIVLHSLKRHSPFSSHPAGQLFSEQTASNMIGYSLSNDWNAVSGTPAIGKFLPGGAVRKRRFEKIADWLNG